VGIVVAVPLLPKATACGVVVFAKLATTDAVPSAMVSPLVAMLEPMPKAVSVTLFVMPIALEGMFSVAFVAQSVVTVAGTATPSRVAPAGPFACHWQYAGVPALVLASVMLP